MKKSYGLLLMLLFVLIGQSVFGQNNKELALAKAKQAIRLEDEEGKFDEAIKLLEEAQMLDAENMLYPYEIAYAYYSKKDYKRASDILEKLLTHKDVNERVYQTLGNAYDYQGKPEKAVTTYEAGLSKFPKSGELYLELGNMQMAQEQYKQALDYYEAGIDKDPAFASNYYWAATLFCHSTEEVWGVMYGEIFMNLERNSQRTAAISKLLFDTYKQGITIESDTAYAVSFSQNMTIDADDIKKSETPRLPFGTGCYEMVLLLAIVGEQQIDINSLDRIRTRFVDRYFEVGKAEDYPNILLDYQQKVKQAGHLEAYNHWILMQGDKEGFEAWYLNNKEKWEGFKEWFTTHQIDIDDTHKLTRLQY